MNVAAVRLTIGPLKQLHAAAGLRMRLAILILAQMVALGRASNIQDMSEDFTAAAAWVASQPNLNLSNEIKLEVSTVAG